MTKSIHVHDDHGERIFLPGDFPLEIGGDEADVRMIGVNGKSLAQVGLEADTPYLHPGTEPVRVNGTLKTSACWLSDGDIITFGDGHVIYRQRGEQMFVHARSRVAKATPPPADADGDAAHEIIEPIAFQPKRGNVISVHRGTRILQVAVIAIFALLAAATWFMFTARSVNLIIEPEPPRIALSGALLTPRVGGRYLLRPGTYQVRADLMGYLPLDSEIKVGGSSNQQFVLQMEKLPGLISVSATDLPGAEVLIDGTQVGVTPLTDFAVPAGLHRLVVRAKKHLSHEQEIEVEGLHVQQSIAVSLQPNWAPVSFSSKPPGAIVAIDGESVGETPLSAEVEAGDRELKISLAGYKQNLQLISISAGVPLTVPEQTLVEADGKLIVKTSPADVSVTVDGQFRGRSPLELSIRPGKKHRVSFTKPGYESANRTVELTPDQRAPLSVSLTPIVGSLRIVTSPADAELIVDGRLRGAADQVLSLNVRPHTIEIRKAGYASHVETVTPRRGLEQRITVVLKTVAEAALAELPTSIPSAAGSLRLIRGGTLRMGSVRREQGRRSNEVRRDVELTREFYIGETEVSNAAFREFLATHSSGFVGGVSLDGDDQPVVRVSWQQAARFCNWLSDRDGLANAYVDREGRLVAVRPMNTGYRLPSEAEWAWVARFAASAQPRKFIWGSAVPPPAGAGNFADHAAGSLVAQRLDNYDDAHSVTAPVGSFPANPLGLSELAGNVTEWTHDYYEIAAVDPFLSLVDPLGPEFGDQHVIRGASWMKGTIGELRSAFRDHGAQGRPDLGFRVARYAR
ncbi:MAG: PEGA domain-containing protein [Gammaproteobacteria bacterium]|nr:PEGA domain-containing protein [Gammaproteobacteria bacterium]